MLIIFQIKSEDESLVAEKSKKSPGAKRKRKVSPKRLDDLPVKKTAKSTNAIKITRRRASSRIQTVVVDSDSTDKSEAVMEPMNEVISSDCSTMNTSIDTVDDPCPAIISQPEQEATFGDSLQIAVTPDMSDSATSECNDSLHETSIVNPFTPHEARSMELPSKLETPGPPDASSTPIVTRASSVPVTPRTRTKSGNRRSVTGRSKSLSAGVKKTRRRRRTTSQVQKTYENTASVSETDSKTISVLAVQNSSVTVCGTTPAGVTPRNSDSVALSGTDTTTDSMTGREGDSVVVCDADIATDDMTMRISDSTVACDLGTTPDVVTSGKRKRKATRRFSPSEAHVKLGKTISVVFCVIFCNVFFMCSNVCVQMNSMYYYFMNL